MTKKVENPEKRTNIDRHLCKSCIYRGSRVGLGRCNYIAVEGHRSDGTLNNTAVTGNYEDLVLIEGDNKVTITDGFDLKVIPYWRYL